MWRKAPRTCPALALVYLLPRPPIARETASPPPPRAPESSHPTLRVHGGLSITLIRGARGDARSLAARLLSVLLVAVALGCERSAQLRVSELTLLRVDWEDGEMAEMSKK